MRRSTSRILVLATAAVVASACGANDGSPPAKAAPTAAVAANAQPAELGLARAVTMTDIDGRAVATATSAAQPTVVIFFASWCQPCRNELALLGAIKAEQPDVRVIGLNAYEEYSDFSDEQRLRGFLAVNAPWLQVVRADSKLMVDFGGVPKIPTVFVYSGDGKLVQEFRREQRRPPGRAELEAALAAAKERGATASR